MGQQLRRLVPQVAGDGLGPDRRQLEHGIDQQQPPGPDEYGGPELGPLQARNALARPDKEPHCHGLAAVEAQGELGLIR